VGPFFQHLLVVKLNSLLYNSFIDKKESDLKYFAIMLSVPNHVHLTEQVEVVTRAWANAQAQVDVLYNYSEDLFELHYNRDMTSKLMGIKQEEVTETLKNQLLVVNKAVNQACNLTQSWAETWITDWVEAIQAKNDTIWSRIRAWMCDVRNHIMSKRIRITAWTEETVIPTIVRERVNEIVQDWTVIKKRVDLLTEDAAVSNLPQDLKKFTDRSMLISIQSVEDFLNGNLPKVYKSN
jgi:hypothetical protein